MAIAFFRLFQPGKIGNMEVKNRIVMPPMGTDYASEEGYVTQRQIEYYAERAKGGVGLVIVEASCVQSPIGKGFQGQIVVDHDKYLPGLSRLAEAIKKNGAKAAIQLHHAGNAAPIKATGGLQPVAPSAVTRRSYPTARALTTAEIKEIIGCFIEAALRVCRAGFDAVEIHSAHHYLLAQFLSPAWNERTDEYGGALANRVRVLVEIVKGIKERAPDLPVICRFNGREYGVDEFLGGRRGLTLEEACEVARLVERAGADAVHVSCEGWGRYAVINIPPTPGEMLPLAEAVKKAVSIPVIAVGRLDPRVGELALKEGKADFIAIGRALLADPYLPQKAADGKLEEITPCISCYNCLRISATGFEPVGLKCTTNPACGQEGQYRLERVERAKKVVVVGGGVAGMTAARTAALRGHRVVLYEREGELGGKAMLAGKCGPRNRYKLIIQYLRKQLHSLGVEIRLNKEASADDILGEDPDVVIMATGARPHLPEIKGIDRGNVATAIDVLAGRAEVGERVVIIGGEKVGCMTAEYLADRGKKVTVLRRERRMATKISPFVRRPLLDRLTDKGVVFRGGIACKEITEKGVLIVNPEGKEELVEADSVVIAAGAIPETDLISQLETKVDQIYRVGDAKEPRELIDAIHEGFIAAYSI